MNICTNTISSVASYAFQYHSRKIQFFLHFVPQAKWNFIQMEIIRLFSLHTSREKVKKKEHCVGIFEIHGKLLVFIENKKNCFDKGKRNMRLKIWTQKQNPMIKIVLKQSDLVVRIRLKCEIRIEIWSADRSFINLKPKIASERSFCYYDRCEIACCYFMRSVLSIRNRKSIRNNS